ncbi:histidine phosphatase family protein [Stella sp.]|uniref:histidine phosphatase family protein n=1 Tax=Stella sp. TaxID=2912054 RepID=UPI0035B3AA3A
MILVRHGQSEFNAAFSVTRVDPGIHDPRLTDEGRRQAALAAEALAAMPVRRLVASPYTRAIETAEIIRGVLGLPLTVDPIVGERAAYACDVGSMTSQLKARWPHLGLDHLDERWWPEMEEPEHRLLDRCARFRAAMAAREDWRHVAVVTHWGFIRGLTGKRVGNGAVVPFDPNAPAPTVFE